MMPKIKFSINRYHFTNHATPTTSPRNPTPPIHPSQTSKYWCRSASPKSNVPGSGTGTGALHTKHNRDSHFPNQQMSQEEFDPDSLDNDIKVWSPEPPNSDTFSEHDSPGLWNYINDEPNGHLFVGGQCCCCRQEDIHLEPLKDNEQYGICGPCANSNTCGICDRIDCDQELCLECQVPCCPFCRAPPSPGWSQWQSNEIELQALCIRCYQKKHNCFQ